VEEQIKHNSYGILSLTPEKIAGVEEHIPHNSYGMLSLTPEQ
jgi:hypothetical protein